MMLLGTKDESIVAHLDEEIEKKCTCHEIQNVLLNIVPGHVSLFLK